MAVFINPFTDFGFKRLFGQEDSKDILIGFLNALFEGELKVSHIVYRDKEKLGESARDRSMIYDIYCTGEDGREYIVEMQNKSHVNFEDRALYYASRSIVGQAQKGSKWQYELRPVIGIYFMNYTEDVLKGRFRSDYMLIEKKTHQRLSNRLRMIFLQMKCFKKTQDECKTDLDKWTYIMNHMETLENIPWKAQNELFQKLEELSKVAAMTPEQRAEYDETLRQYRDNLAVRSAAIKEGERRGKKKGKSQALKSIAMKMIDKGMEDSSIVELTGLSLDEVNKMRSGNVS